MYSFYSNSAAARFSYLQIICFCLITQANVWSQLPYLVLAILNILSLSIAYFCLPEKRDKLPTTVRETIEQQKQTENNAV